MSQKKHNTTHNTQHNTNTTQHKTTHTKQKTKNKTKQNKTKQNKTKQNKHNKTKQKQSKNKTETNSKRMASIAQQQNTTMNLFQDFMAKTPLPPQGQQPTQGQNYIQEVIDDDVKKGHYTRDQLHGAILDLYSLEDTFLFGTNTHVGTEVTKLQYHLQNIMCHSGFDGGFDFMDTPVSNSVTEMNMNDIPYVRDVARMATHMSSPMASSDVLDWAARLSTETVLGKALKELVEQLEMYRVPTSTDACLTRVEAFLQEGNNEAVMATLRNMLKPYANLEVYNPTEDDYFTGDRYGTQHSGVDMYGRNGTSYITHLLNEAGDQVSDDNMDECIMETFCLTQNNNSHCSWLHKTLFHIRGESRFRESQLFIIVETIRHIFLSFIFSMIQKPIDHSVYPIPMWKLKQH